MTAVPSVTPRRLGPDRFALGSWHIFPRLTLDEGAGLVRRALDLGITLFDVGDYWDHELSNERRFQEIVSLLGLVRSDYRIGVKVFTNSVERRADILRRSLDRLGIEQADYTVCSRPAQGESLEHAVDEMAGLVSNGLTREIAVSLWSPGPLKEAMRLLEERNLPGPRFIQLQYNVCRRAVVEGADHQRLFSTTGIGLQAADTLEGGLLTGHLHRRRYDPEDRDDGIWFPDRNIPRDSGGIREEIRARAPLLAQAASDLGVTPAQLAIAFALLHPQLDTLLFGATNPAHLAENLGAIRLAEKEPEAVLASVRSLGVEGAAPPPLFDISAGMH